MRQKRPDRVLGGCHDAFWEGCAAGELRLQRCRLCEALLAPPMQACERCGGEAFELEAMSGQASLVSWCTFERDYYNGVLPIPWPTILVELAEGPLMISNPEGFDPAEAPSGMALRLAWADCEDSAGPYRLPVFAPA